MTMSGSPGRTRRYVLAERPATLVGPLQEGVLRYEEDVPVPRLEAGQVLVEVGWMSLDARGQELDERHPDFPPALTPG
ncbi:hypothetical protein PV350_07880 [Streptomyces sp. PA03-6a]|nr:hypothetical protein [Streptomyces sp. PA03-6a]